MKGPIAVQNAKLSIQLEVSAPSDESAASPCTFRVYCSPMARPWQCYIRAVKTTFNTVESVISYESEVVRSKFLKEDAAAPTHVCRASNEKACRIKADGCEDSARKNFFIQYRKLFCPLHAIPPPITLFRG